MKKELKEQTNNGWESSRCLGQDPKESYTITEMADPNSHLFLLIILFSHL